MQDTRVFTIAPPRVLPAGLAVALVVSGLAGGIAARADDDARLRPGNLLLSRVIFDNNPKTVVAGVTLLPPNCVGTACVKATDGGAYPGVWNNALVDASFGITSKIVLDQLTPSGQRLGSI
jgi:hypothetical protein